VGDVLRTAENALDGPALVLTLLLLLAIGWYLSYLAARLDRLHQRVESSMIALEARLAARAAIAREAGRLLPGPAGPALVAAATRSLTGGPDATGDNRARSLETREKSLETRENELARALQAAFEERATATRLRADPEGAELLDELAGAGDRVQLARRFHNDAVAHTQRMRRKRVVRWARLAGRARMPQMVEIDDSHPDGLGWDA
jgi:hypothetical protein